ncbi:DUF4184 family protein [Clostridium botulinum]|nr:DUF4184 family protein [Clostridium botulinum]MBO0576501.1 DUF4184 family protein [Clostridium botulinum]
MPFTFSHPAIVLPLEKKWNKYFSFTALILGSMSPDFEYFIRFKPMSTIGHGLIGFFLYNLPLCFVLAYLFHKIIKKPLIVHMPKPIDSRYYNTALKPWRINSLRQALVFSYSAIIGMITHVFWDSFTHKTGKFVILFEGLRKNIVILNYNIPVYKILQHGSTFLGAIFIILYVYSKRNKHINEKKINKIYTKNNREKVFYFTTIFCTGLIVLLVYIFLLNISFSIKNIGSFVVPFINGLFIGTVIASIKYK